MIRASLIISFYKKIEILKLVLAALEGQTVKDFEVIIADDGSPTDITDQIRILETASPLKIRHIWHEDLGFRKTIILNECVRKSESDYLIFIDGDCVPHERFVEAHLRDRCRGVVLAGRRVNLSEKLSKELTEDRIRNGFLKGFFTTRVLLDGIFGQSTHVEKALYVGASWLRALVDGKDSGILGCNFSIHKNDLMEINGFDERYLAPGVGEDSDISVRLRWNGVKVRSIKTSAIQYHMYHRLLDRSAVNDRIYEEVLRQHLPFTPYGISRQVTSPQSSRQA
jgi:glycosyltransferase involved in cell wall biosynthesis